MRTKKKSSQKQIQTTWSDFHIFDSEYFGFPKNQCTFNLALLEANDILPGEAYFIGILRTVVIDEEIIPGNAEETCNGSKDQVCNPNMKSLFGKYGEAKYRHPMHGFMWNNWWGEWTESQYCLLMDKNYQMIDKFKLNDLPDVGYLITSDFRIMKTTDNRLFCMDTQYDFYLFELDISLQNDYELSCINYGNYKLGRFPSAKNLCPLIFEPHKKGYHLIIMDSFSPAGFHAFEFYIEKNLQLIGEVEEVILLSLKGDKLILHSSIDPHKQPIKSINYQDNTELLDILYDKFINTTAAAKQLKMSDPESYPQNMKAGFTRTSSAINPHQVQNLIEATQKKNLQLLKKILEDKDTFKRVSDFLKTLRKEDYFMETEIETVKTNSKLNKSQVGITPNFSFGSPAIEIKPNTYLCIGHHKISHRDLYKTNSSLDMFRRLINHSFPKLFKTNYIPHFGSDTVDPNISYESSEGDYYRVLNGFIYINYFIIIKRNHNNFTGKMSHPFLTIQLDNKYKDYYQFSLDFCPGLTVDHNQVIMSMGKGDYYSSVITFPKKQVIQSCTRNISHMNLQKSQYQLFIEHNHNKHCLSVKQDSKGKSYIYWNQKKIHKKPEEFDIETYLSYKPKIRTERK